MGRVSSEAGAPSSNEICTRSVGPITRIARNPAHVISHSKNRSHSVYGLRWFDASPATADVVAAPTPVLYRPIAETAHPPGHHSAKANAGPCVLKTQPILSSLVPLRLNSSYAASLGMSQATICHPRSYDLSSPSYDLSSRAKRGISVLAGADRNPHSGCGRTMDY